MSRLHWSDTVVVHRDAVDVFAYLADFHRAHEWRAEVRESTMRPPGPLGVGSVLREVSTIAGRRVVIESEVDAYEDGVGFGFRPYAGPLPTWGSFTVTPTAGGSRLRFDLTVELAGGWALLAPAFRLSVPRRTADSLDELRFRLEAAAVTLVPRPPLIGWS